MITLSEWAATIARARVEIPRGIEIEVKVNAELAAGIARRSIGHLQPERVVGPPTPSYFAPWPELAPRTISEKTGLGFGPPDWEPLLRSGQGRDSIEAMAVGNVGGVVSNDKVMFYHEVGTAEMPPRPVFAPAVALTMPSFEKALSLLAVNALKPVKP